MDIDISTIIIVVIALSFFAVPIFIDQKRKKKQKELEKQLMDFASDNDLILDQHEVWGENYALGLNKKSKKLIYLNYKQTNPLQIIDLKQVRSCRAVSSYNTNKKSDHLIDIKDTVHLILRYKTDESDEQLEFFSSENNRVMQNENNLADKWAGYVKANLN